MKTEEVHSAYKRLSEVYVGVSNDEDGAFGDSASLSEDQDSILNALNIHLPKTLRQAT